MDPRSGPEARIQGLGERLRDKEIVQTPTSDLS
jgi:hypothetical protein